MTVTADVDMHSHPPESLSQDDAYIEAEDDDYAPDTGASESDDGDVSDIDSEVVCNRHHLPDACITPIARRRLTVHSMESELGRPPHHSLSR
jgi:hypothetical protein